MGSICYKYILLATFVLSIEGINTNKNDKNNTGKIIEETRDSKANRRIIKLYSGSRPKPIVCNGEGFQVDSDDCSIFHRCVKSGSGRYLTYKFQCSPGTIFDPDAQICNHPEKTKRAECGGQFGRPIESSYDNEINKEIPFPISTKEPVYTNQKPYKDLWTSKVTVTSLETSNLILNNAKENIEILKTTPSSLSLVNNLAAKPNTESNAIHPTTIAETSKSLQKLRPMAPNSVTFNNRKQIPQLGEICTSDGFIGDRDDCRKFYRCVGNQRGGFIRYDFFCSELTIWDDERQICNHAMLVSKRRCGRDNKIGPKKEAITEPSRDLRNEPPINQNDDQNELFPASQTQLQINYGSKVTQQQTQISKGKVKQNQTQINYHINGTADQNQTQFSYGSAMSQSQSQINYGDKAVQTQIQIDHSNEASQSQSQIAESTTSKDNSQSSTKSPVSNKVCTESGFMGDPDDCKKFYRCVDNGRGSFTRYEFSCGDGTVWDSNMESCNHAWAVTECGGKGTTDSSSKKPIPSIQTTLSPSVSTSSPSTTTQNYYIPEEPTIEENNDIPYGNQPTSSTTNKPITTATKEPQNTNENRCKSNGFMGDNIDCKKFYRCVDNGNEQYTRYEFSCGEGTVWDPKIEACNHAWAVKKCGGYYAEDNVQMESTTVAGLTTKSPLLSTSHIVPSQIDDYDTGYGQQDDSSPVTSITKTTMPFTTTETTSMPISHTSDPDNTCKNSGFMGDNSDCKKFYRCVDNGNGAYTKYEFHCGEGTVWDQTIQACNHPWAVEKCGGTSTEGISIVNEVDNTIYTTEHSLTSESESDIGYGEQNNASQQPTTMSTSSTNIEQGDKTICTSSGFKGDSNDCQKFYRCVDNGKGSFTQYEFKCAEGTVWDTKIEVCNHAWAVEKCGGANIFTESQYTTTSEMTPNLNDDTNQGGYPVQNDDYSTEKPKDTTTSSYTSSTITSNANSDNTCKNNGFMGDSNDCKKFYRCVDNGMGGYIKYDFTCGEGTVWNQEISACDHESENSNCALNESKTTTKPQHVENNDKHPESTTNDTLSSSSEGTTEINEVQNSNATCLNEGFYGDPNNCKNFYRCVDNGQGSYTKYEFTCGEGTFWDQEILACNHISNNTNCKNSMIGTSTTSKPNSENTQHTNPPQQEVSTTEILSNSDKNDRCTEEGFFANSKDCKKFYRCVSNNKGTFTKYEFSCGDGTIWVQEIQACDHDNGITSCINDNKPIQQQTTENYQYTTSSHSTMQSYDKENDEYANGNSEKPDSSNKQCKSEGFYSNQNDCRQFYRCVEDGKGGYTKYDFTCGEGTAWDSNTQTCNHINEVENCNNSNQDGNQMQPTINDEEASQTTQSTSTSTGNTDLHVDSCEQEGFFGNTEDCTKFYRCVDDGKGGFIKYDFDCGEGTIWDQDVTTCNHPQDVQNLSCKSNQEASSQSSSTTSSSTMSSTSNGTTSESQATDSTQSSNTQNYSCEYENSNKTSNEQVKCEKAGYYANPNDCKKFYRCVDWDGQGEKFSVFHFECGDGTIWDPQLDTCNHEDSVYPPRNCSRNQNQESSANTDKCPTQETSTASDSTTSQQTPTTELTTQQSTTTEQTTQISTTSEQTTKQTTTSERTTQQTTTTEQTTTSEHTTQPQSTSVQTTTQQLTTEQTTTESIEETTIRQTTTSEITSTTEGTTEQTTTEQQSTEDKTTTESSILTTDKDNSTTTESDEHTTTEETSNENQECPETEDDQYLYVCPTSFRRHPEYCNMFYQCDENEESHEIKIATFTCPNDTIYDENQTKCVEKDKATKKCDGQKVRKYRVKRLNKQSREPIVVDQHEHKCHAVGYYPFEKDNECSRVFLKCQQTRRGKLRGYVYQCPQGYVYWSISKRCEKLKHMTYCQPSSSRNWNDRWEIPVEMKNVAK